MPSGRVWTRRTTVAARLSRLLRDPSLRQRLSLTGRQAIDYLELQREVWRQALAVVSGRLG
jgi:hypothetical protein